MINQQCRKCKEVKSVSQFNKDKTMKDGYKLYCKDCRKIDSKKYSSENKDKIKLYFETNKDILKLKRKIYYDKPETQKRLIKYRKSDNNLKSQQQYRKRNREYLLAKLHRRNALKKSLLHPDHNKDVELELFKECKRLTLETGFKWSVDHIYPLHHGGPHWHLNLQVVPHLYNLRKNNNLDYRNEYLKHWTELPKEVLDWINEKSLTNQDPLINSNYD